MLGDFPDLSIVVYLLGYRNLPDDLDIYGEGILFLMILCELLRLLLYCETLR